MTAETEQLPEPGEFTEHSERSSSEGGFGEDVEKHALLQHESEPEVLDPQPSNNKQSSNVQFLAWTVVNTLATIGIVSHATEHHLRDIS